MFCSLHSRICRQWGFISSKGNGALNNNWGCFIWGLARNFAGSWNRCTTLLKARSKYSPTLAQSRPAINQGSTFCPLGIKQFGFVQGVRLDVSGVDL